MKRAILNAAALAALLSGCDNSTMIAGCESTADIHVICGITKPEDLEPLGDHPWILISELGSFGAEGVPGAIAAYNTETDAVIRLESTVADQDPDSMFPRCGPPPESLRPRGFHVSDLGPDSFRLLVVNASSGERIERYRLDVAGPDLTLAWEGCVAIPDTLFANDVAALGGDAFVVSHMYTPPRSQLLTARFFFGLDTGYAATWSPEGGWTKVEGTDTAFPNGVEADPDSGRVFIGATYGEEFIAADAYGNDARSTSIPVQSDNITWSPDGRLLAVGHTGTPLFGIAGCREAGGAPCSFPFAVVAVDPDTLEQDIIYEHTDGLIPGASVALWHRDSLYMGTVFGDRISRVKLED